MLKICILLAPPQKISLADSGSDSLEAICFVSVPIFYPIPQLLIANDMKVAKAELYDITTLGLPKPKCNVYVVHVQIDNINERAKEIINVVTDTSWVKKLGVIRQTSYNARMSKTIEKLVSEILSKVNGTVTEDFGEYLISDSATVILVDHYGHTKVPLAELWKEKETGNPGFDFHTVSTSQLIVYGEAKYNSSQSAYGTALKQIGSFIDDKKDEMDFVHLEDFVSPEAMQNALDNNRGYIAAFSLHGKNSDTIFKNALESDHAKKLFCHSELYLIGIEICS